MTIVKMDVQVVTKRMESSPGTDSDGRPVMRTFEVTVRPTMVGDIVIETDQEVEMGAKYLMGDVVFSCVGPRTLRNENPFIGPTFMLQDIIPIYNANL